MTASELEAAIGEELTPDAAAYWDGCSRELLDEYVIYAQTHGLKAALGYVELDSV